MLTLRLLRHLVEDFQHRWAHQVGRRIYSTCALPTESLGLTKDNKQILFCINTTVASYEVVKEET